MQWRRGVALIGLTFAGLILAGCAASGSLAPPGMPAQTEIAADETPVAMGTPAAEVAVAESAAPEQPAITAAAAIEPTLAASPGARSTPTSPPAARGATPQPAGEMIGVTLATGSKIALIDPLTGKLTRAVDLSQPRGKMTLAPDGRSAWTFGLPPHRASVAVFDVLSGGRGEDVQLRSGDTPAAVAFSTDGARAYVALSADPPSPPAAGTIVFMSGNGKELGRVSVGRQTPGVQIRRQLSSLAVVPGSNGDVLYAGGESSGVVWALDATSGTLLHEIEVGGGPTRIVADPARERAYVLLDTLNQVVAIDTTSFAVINRLALPARPKAAVVGSDGKLFIAGGDGSGELWVVAPDATDIRSRVPVGGEPVGLAMSTDGKSLYIPDAATSALAIMTADTMQVTRTVPLGSAPLDVVAAYGSPQGQQVTGAPMAAVRASPAPLPSLAPTPTPLPEGARQPDQLPAGTIAEPFLSGADNPVALAFAPDGRLFYNELHTGRIRVVQNGTLLPEPFYQFLISDQPKAGLVGLTLDPDFAKNHYVYVLFTSVSTDARAANGPNEVVRLTDVGNKGTDLTPVLQDLPSTTASNFSTLRFGPDGKLYVTVADDDKGTHTQDLGSLAGKILRVNPDGSIPDDNPFIGDAKKQGTIWAYGLHDTTSLAFHPVGHDMLALDTGTGNNDELDLIARGANYGSPASGYNFKPGITDPIAVINPAIRPAGSAFYTADQIAEWTNDWFYCNQDAAQLRRVRLAPVSFDRVVFEEVVKEGCTYDVATGPDGALYYSDAKGIYRIRQPEAQVLAAVR